MGIHFNWETVCFIVITIQWARWDIQPLGALPNHLMQFVAAQGGTKGSLRTKVLLPLPTVEQGLEQTHVCRVDWG
jgi:hypothetical protein